MLSFNLTFNIKDLKLLQTESDFCGIFFIILRNCVFKTTLFQPHFRLWCIQRHCGFSPPLSLKHFICLRFQNYKMFLLTYTARTVNTSSGAPSVLSTNITEQCNHLAISSQTALSDAFEHYVNKKNKKTSEQTCSLSSNFRMEKKTFNLCKLHQRRCLVSISLSHLFYIVFLSVGVIKTSKLS